MTDFTFYDNEATGLSVRHDQITQFGGITCGPDMKVKEKISIFIKLLPYVVPHPDALRVTRKTADELSNPKLPSEFDSVRNISNFLSTNRDESRVFVTFNGLKYDDELLRTALYRNLREPFFNSGKNHIKIDLLSVLRMVHGLTPDVLNITYKDDGKPSYRLEDVCPANGIEIHAHDALNDSIATRDLFVLIKEKAPWAIDIAMRSGSTRQVLDIVELSMSENKPIYNFTSFGTPLLTPLVIIAKDKGKKFIGIDVNSDVEEAKSKDIADQLFSANTPFELITANKSPLLMTAQEVLNVTSRELDKNLQAKVDNINSDSTLKRLADQAFKNNTYQKVNNPTSEEDIYGGFYASSDKRQMDRFHTSKAWEEKTKILFSDRRLKDFSARIILEAVSQSDCFLPADVINQLGQDCAEAVTRPFHVSNDRYNTISQCIADGADEDWVEWAKNKYGDHPSFDKKIAPEQPAVAQFSFTF